MAAYRLTRLVSADGITLPFRVRVYRWAYRDRRDLAGVEEDSEWEQIAFLDDNPPKVVELIHCRWCVGVYAGVGVTAARLLLGRRWDPIARALVASTAAALIAGLERD